MKIRTYFSTNKIRTDLTKFEKNWDQDILTFFLYLLSYIKIM